MISVHPTYDTQIRKIEIIQNFQEMQLSFFASNFQRFSKVLKKLSREKNISYVITETKDGVTNVPDSPL